MKLSIKDFYKGKTSSPYLLDGSFWKSQNLDIHGQEGIARINYKPTGHTGTGTGEITAIITSFVSLSGVGGLAVFADSGKNVKRFTDTTTTLRVGAAASGPTYYVANWKGYIFSAGTTAFKATLINGGMDAAWTTISSSLEDMSNHKILASLGDGHLYICNKNKVARLVQNTGETFDPANAATFTLTLGAVVMDSGWQVESIEEFGRFLALFVDIKEQNRTGIFLWDRASGEFDAMFEIKEPRMTRTLEHHGEIYITGGHQGNIWKLTESGLRKFTQIKIGDYDNQNYVLSGGYLDYGTLTFSTMAIWKNRLMIGVSTSGTIEPTGIYSVDVETGVVNHEFNVSTGNKVTGVRIGSMIVLGDYLFWGLMDTNETPTLYSLQSIRDDANRWNDYTCYFETPLIRAGAKLQKNSISRIETILARPLQTGEGVRLKYRKNINDSWITLGTKDYASDGAQSSLVFPGIPGIENLQLKVEMTTGASSKNTPYIQEILLF